MIWIILGVVVLVLLYVMATYNKLIKGRNKVEGEWAQIDVQLKRRADLIPNLVETVKGYAAHEKETLDAVISARSKAIGANTTEEKIEANKELTSAISRLLVVAENYPELKANTNFLDLQSSLKETEDKIAYARQFYNDAAKSFKNAVEMFPSNIIAGMFGFKALPFFEVTEADRETPEVKF